MNTSENNMKELALTVAAFGSSLLLKKILEEGYQRTFDEEPPNTSESDEINWGKVIGWAVVSGVSAAVLKTLVKRMGRKEIK